MTFSGKLNRLLVLMVSFDARKVAKQAHQTMICMRIVNQLKLAWSPQAIIPLGVYEGFDSIEMLLAHGQKSECFNDILELIDGTQQLTSPDADRKPFNVDVFVSADGAARKAGLGRTSYASNFPMTWNHMTKSEYKNIDLYACLTLCAKVMKTYEPGPSCLTHEQRLAHARKNFGMYAANATGLDPEKFVPDVLHFKLLTINRLMMFTIKAIFNDDPTAVQAFYAHCKMCLGLTYAFGFVDEEKGLITSSLRGNDCQKLLGQGDSIVNCTCDDHGFLNESKRRAITIVWTYFITLINDDENRVIANTMPYAKYFLLAHKALKIGVVVFGADFPSPTMVERRNQIPYFKKILLEMYDLLLSHFDMQGVEHENKHQKALFLRGLKGGGRGDEFEPLKQLMVCTVLTKRN
jgi:hypothetical protein